MDETKRTAAGDLACIREMLDRMVSNFRGLAPVFTALGLALLAYGLLDAGERICYTVLTARAAQAGDEAGLTSLAANFSQALVGTEALLYSALCAVFALGRRRVVREELDGLSAKLLRVWRLCLAGFVILGLFRVFCLPWLVPQSLAQEASAEIYNLMRTEKSGLVSGFAQALFPVLPILITAAFAEDRQLAGLGLAALVLTVLTMLVPATQLGTDMDVTGFLGQYGASVLLRAVKTLVPAAALLLFARRLRRL